VGRLENLPPEKGKERQRKINQRMIRKREKVIYKNKMIPDIGGQWLCCSLAPKGHLTSNY